MAESLQGLDRDHVLAIDSTTTLNQVNLSNIFSATNYPILTSLLAGTNSSYVSSSSSGGAKIPSVSSAPTSPVAGQLWFNSSGNSFQYYNGTSVQTIGTSGAGISSLTVGPNLTAGGTAAGTLTGPGTIDIVNSGVGAGTYPKVTVNSKGLVTYGTGLTESDIPTLTSPGKVSGSAINSGTIGGTTSFYSSGNVTAQNISSGINITRQIQLFDPAAGSAHKITISAPTLTSDFSLIFPSSNGLPGYALTTDGSGNLAWANVASNSLPVLSAGKIWIGNSSSVANRLSTPYGDVALSIAGSATVTGLQGYPVSATAPTLAGQILRWNGSAWMPNSVAMSDLRSTVTGTSALTSCTSAQTLVFNSVTDSLLCSSITIANSQITWGSTGANLVFAGPSSGGAASPAFRSLTVADLPAGSASQWNTVSSTINYVAGFVGIGTATPQAILDVYATGAQSAMLVPRDTTLNRPTGINGMLRYNTISNAMETYANGAWSSVATGASGASQWTTSGSNIYYSSTGNVGIGTNSPVSPLHVVGSIRSDAGFVVSSSGSVSKDGSNNLVINSVSGMTYFTGANVGIGTTGPTEKLHVTGSSGAPAIGSSNTGIAWFGETSGNNGINIGFDNSNSPREGWIQSQFIGNTPTYYNLSLNPLGGNIGIGTTTPQAILDVNGSGTSQSAMIVPRDSTSNRPTGINGMLRYNTSLSQLETYSSGAWSGVATSTGASGSYLPLTGGTLTGSVVHPLGSLSAPSINFGDPTTGLFSTGPGNISFASSGTYQMIVTSSGNVGVGFLNPSSRFNVSSALTTTPVSYDAGEIVAFRNASQPSDTREIAFGTTSDSAAYIRSIRDMSFVTGSTSKMRITSSGIGIGTATPSAQLDIRAANTAGSSAIMLRNGDALSGTVGTAQIAFGYNSTSSYPSFIRTRHNSGGASGNAIEFFTGDGTAAGVFPTNAVLGLSVNGGSVGVGTTSPQALLDVYGTGTTSAMIVPRATTANRPATGVAGMLRYNTDNTSLEMFNGSIWSNLTTAAGGSGSYLPLAGGTLTGVVAHPLGSASAPSINFGDATSGLYSTGSGNITLGTNGLGRLNINSSGYVGIGTTGSAWGFDVNGPVRFQSGTYGSGATAANLTLRATVGALNAADLSFWGSPNFASGSDTTPRRSADITGGIGNGWGSEYLSLNVGIGGTNDSALATTERMRILGNGYVGIGTSAPSVNLDVAGSIQGTNLFATSTNPRHIFRSSDADTSDRIIDLYGTGASATLRVYKQAKGADVSAGYMNITSAGLIGINTVSPVAGIDLSNGEYIRSGGLQIAGVATDPVAYNGASPSGIWTQSGLGLVLKSAGVNAIYMSGGNIGIGTSSPQAILDVNGSGTSQSAMIVPRDSTAMRPTGINGMLRYNTALNAMETFANGAWSTLSTAANGASQWTTNGSNIYYGSGNVGIGTVSPVGSLNVASGRVVVGTTDTGYAALGYVVNGPATYPNIYAYQAGQDATHNVALGWRANSTVGSATGYISSYNGNNALQIQDSGGNTSIGLGYGTLPLSKLDIAGGLAVGTYAGSTAAPSNGLIVSGNVGVGTTSPQALLDVYGTGSSSAMIVPRDSTTNRPTGINGMLRYNVTAGKLEAFASSAWQTLDTSSGTSGAFVNGGNSFGASAVLGTADANSLSLNTNGLPRLSISAAGNVGIGTSAPQSTFQINANGSGNADVFYVGGTATKGFKIQDTGAAIDIQSINAPLYVNNGTSNQIYLMGGNVGVGTTSPLNLFDVAQVDNSPAISIRNLSSTAARYPSLKVQNNGAENGGSPSIVFSNYRGTFGSNTPTQANDSLGEIDFLGHTGSASDQSARIFAQSDGAWSTSSAPAHMTFAVTPAGSVTQIAAVTIANSGNVGIGTTSPQAILDVNGSGTTSAMIVPRASSANRPTGIAGMIRYNTDNAALEMFNGTVWSNLTTAAGGGGAYLPLAGGTLTGVVAHPLGTVGTPTINFGDATTGFFSTGSGNITSTIGGVAKLSMTSSGLGIGTTSPANAVDVFGDSATVASRAATSAGSSSVSAQAYDFWSLPSYQATYIRQNGSAGSGTTAGISNASLGILSFQNNLNGLILTNGAAPIEIATASIERMRVTAMGNVGIGTATPLQLLHVYGSGNSVIETQGSTFGTLLAASGSHSGILQASVGGSIYAGSSSADPFLLVTGGVERMRLDTSGNVGVGTTSPQALLDVYGTGTSSAMIVPRASSASRPSGVAGMIRYNTDNLALEMYNGSAWSNLATAASGGSQWTTSGSNIYYGSGNVGIGTTSPSDVLEVAAANGTTPRIRLTQAAQGTWALSEPAGTNSLQISQGTGSGIPYLTILGSGGVAGNVGIGTTSPNTPLQIVTTDTSGLQLQVTSTNSSTGRAGISINNSNAGAGFQIQQLANGSAIIQNYGSGNITAFLGGNVGVGTSAPVGKLQVFQSTDSSTTGLTVTNSSGTRSTFVWTDGSNNARIDSGAAGTSPLILNSGGGNVGIGTTSPAFPLSTVGTIATYNSDWVSNSAGSGLRLSTGAASGSTYGQIQAVTLGNSAVGNLVLNPVGGNVGVGTTSPQALLDVYGSANTNSAVIVPRATIAQRPTSPVNGMIRYQIDNQTLEAYTNGSWSNLGAGAGSGQWTTSGSNIYYNSTGNVGIGTSTTPATLSLLSPDSGRILSFADAASGGYDIYANVIHTTSRGSSLNFSANDYNSGAVTQRGLLALNVNGNVGIGTTTPNSTLQSSGSFATGLSVKASAYTLGLQDNVVLGNATSGAFTLTLPSAIGIIGRQYILKKIDSSMNAVTIATTGGQTIDGASTASLSTQYQFLAIASDGTNWVVIGSNGSPTNNVAASFTNVTGAAASSLITTSTSTTGTGYITVTVSGQGSPQISSNGSGWGTSATVVAGQTLGVRLTSATAAVTSYTVSLSGLSNSPSWTVTTSACGSGSQTFNSSGTFTRPDSSCTLNVLAIGGGGSGSGNYGSGGGSGYVQQASLNASSVTSAVAITVGTGGGGGSTNSTSGSMSSFGSYLTANGGVGGLGYSGSGRPNADGGSGGSGGGSSSANGGAGGGSGSGSSLYSVGGAGGSGQGGFNFSAFTVTAISNGVAGQFVYTGTYAGGGGGGGVFIGGAGPNAGAGGATSASGYGAGGGGANSGTVGSGANGVVYVEWK